MKLHYILIYLCICIICIVSTAENYGNFKLTIKEVEICKGPKRNDCAMIKQKIIDSTGLMFNMNVTQSMSPSKGKIVAISNGKQLVRLQVANPCHHLFLRPLFISLLNVSNDCVVKTGLHTFFVDINKIAQSYYGGAFVYGNLTFKAFFYSNECNLSCVVLKVELCPRDNKISGQ